MSFVSIQFAIFLPIVFLLYWALPHKYRWVLLLISSYYFYMSWNPTYVVLILFTTIVSYGAALLMEKQQADKAGTVKKKRIMTWAIILCLAVLFIFKYFNFTMTFIRDVSGLFAIKMSPITVKLLLPVGISFYTFQTLSYVIDVYRGKVEAEHHFGIYATYISFFPQLVAGPIERSGNLLPQLKSEKKFDYDQAAYGMKLMAWGFFKKMVVADQLSSLVDAVYNNIEQYDGFVLFIATVMFALQVYCDFSGYSDIAIGSAKLMGINLMVNFRSPYFSASMSEIWRRWHISLNKWFVDYLYIPMGGSRKGKARAAFNKMFVFFVSGLWHGANYTYVAWAVLNGAATGIEEQFAGKNKKKQVDDSLQVHNLVWWIRVLLVFLFWTFTLFFFRANKIQDAFYVLGHLFVGASSPVAYLLNGWRAIGLGGFRLVEVAISVLVLAIYDYCSLRTDVIAWTTKQKVVVRYGLYAVVLLLIMFCRATGDASFVYFQF